MTTTVGADISQAMFDAAHLGAEGKDQAQEIRQHAGFAAFLAWLIAFGGDKPLAEFLAAQGWPVSVVNPARIHAFAGSEMSRAKTDKADAKPIARFAQEKKPALWTPPPPAIRELQVLLRRVEDLLEMRQMAQNRLDTADPTVTGSIKAILERLDQELDATRERIRQHIDDNPDLRRRRGLLESPASARPAPPTCWWRSASTTASTMPSRPSPTPGWPPGSRSPASGRGKPVCPRPATRCCVAALYLPAVVAWRHNPAIRAFCKRLKANGKNGKAVACAAMRELVHIAFAILKSGKPFDPNFVNILFRPPSTVVASLPRSRRSVSPPVSTTPGTIPPRVW